jgi:hypothetical protein
MNMNLYCENKQLWKILNLWYLAFFPIAFFCIHFLAAPFAFLYMGVRAKNKWWMTLFFITFAIYLLPFLTYNFSHFSRLPLEMLFVFNCLIFIYLLLTAKKFLWQLELQHIYASVSPPASPVVPDASSFQAMVDAVLTELKHWRTTLKDPVMQAHAQKMIDFVDTLVILDDEKFGKKFINRYKDTLNTLFGKYSELEKSLIMLVEIRQTLENIECSMQKIVAAAEKEVIQMYQYNLMQVNAESNAFVQGLRNRGLVD